MAAAPSPDLPEDPEDPQVILRDLPGRDRERDFFLSRYQAEAAAAAADPASYQRLRQFLRAWSLRVIAVNSPGYYEDLAEVRAGARGIPAEEAFPDWNERIEAARAARA
jgi:hypothetical protein